jgi:hypothetical protein
MDATASATVECITNGAITPATSALATLPRQACRDDAMPRRSGTRSSSISVTTGTISAQPKANSANSGMAQNGLGGSHRLSSTFTTDTVAMTRNPRRICRCGGSLPASRPDQPAPAMIPPMVAMKNQKNCVGPRCRCSPRNTGADSTYKNMPLKGTPEAKASAMNTGLPAICA